MCFVSWYSSGTENATKPNAIASSACFSPIAMEGAVRHARRGRPRCCASLSRHGKSRPSLGGEDGTPSAIHEEIRATTKNRTHVSPTYLATYEVLRMSR